MDEKGEGSDVEEAGEREADDDRGDEEEGDDSELSREPFRCAPGRV